MEMPTRFSPITSGTMAHSGSTTQTSHQNHAMARLQILLVTVQPPQQQPTPTVSPIDQG
jgi:hypothetical protein